MPDGSAVAERLLHETTSLCRHCKNAVPAQVVAVGNEVHMRKRCEAHGAQSAMLSDDAAWYERTRAHLPPPRRRRAQGGGARLPVRLRAVPEPRAEGPAAGGDDHQRLQPRLPDLLRAQQERRRVPHGRRGLRASPRAPASRPRRRARHHQLHRRRAHACTRTSSSFVEHAHEAGIHRVTSAPTASASRKDEALRAAARRELEARVALSFDTFDSAADKRAAGRAAARHEARAAWTCSTKHDVDTTLIPVMTRGVQRPRDRAASSSSGWTLDACATSRSTR